MDWYAWTGMRNEPELRSLYEWLDTQTNCAGGKAGAILGSVIGCSYAFAVLLGVVLIKGTHTDFRSNWAVIAWPLVGATVLSLGTCAWYYLRQASQQKANWRRLGSSRSFVWKLYSARWMGNVKDTIGAESAAALNGASYDFLRCNAALRSPAWRGLSSDSAWVSARDKAEAAMEAAMARLMTMLGHGGSPEKPEVQKLLEDKHETAEEIVKTADRLAIRKGLTGDVSDELRQVLTEMKFLNAAHDEVMELDVRG